MSRLATTTRGRLTLIAVLVLVVAAAIADAAVYFSSAAVEMGAADATLTAQAGALGAGLQESNSQVTFEGSQVPAETSSGVAVDVAVVSGTSVAQTAQRSLREADLLALARAVRSGRSPVWANFTDLHGAPRRAYAELLPGTQGSGDVLIVSRSLAELDASLSRLLVALAAISLPAVALGGWLAHWLAGRVLRPVRNIAETARSLSERDLHRRVEVSVPADELGELVTTFNGMLGRLEASFDSLSRFTADASHELRAPLTLMRTEIDVALAASRPAAEYRRVLGAVRGEVEHLSRLADQLLFLARADAGALVPAREPVDVADLVHETAARWGATSRSQGVRIRVEAPASGVVAADPALIRRVLDNLIDNAVRHSPPRGRVTISAAEEAGWWAIRVGDQGPGVPASLRPRLFARFARAEDSRTPEGRTGLGLALSASIAAAHGGELRLLEGPGSNFELRLPAELPEPVTRSRSG